MRKIAVIGAGIGGIAAAIRMRRRNFEIDVYDHQPGPGGKLAEFRRKGFRFDMGPSLFTQPERVMELFEMAGEDPGEHLPYHRLDLVCRYYYPDGTMLDVPSDPVEFAGKASEVFAVEPGDITGYLEKASKLYATAGPVFLDRPFPAIDALMSEEGKAIGKKPWILDPFVSLHRRNRASFGDHRLVQMFDRFATYNGSNPYKAPATLKMIAHLEHNLGAFFPQKGMYAITDELFKLAVRQGVKFHFGKRVDEIVEDDAGSKVSGIKINGEFLSCDKIISDVDVNTLYRGLLKSRKIPFLAGRQQLSSSAMIFYWGVRGEYPKLDIHNILFSGSYKEEFDHLFRKKKIFADPTVYIFISSKIVPGDAPEGCENWFVMINVPENTGQDWDKYIAEMREVLIAKIRMITGIDISGKILTEHVEDPRTIESRTGSYHGSLYGNSSNSRTSAFSRHANYRGSIKNLYFVGGSVHPGGGIPLCLASAGIVEKIIAKDDTSPANPLS